MLCFQFFTVHGRRAARESAGNSRTGKNREGGGDENAVVWHEGKKRSRRGRRLVGSSRVVALFIKIIENRMEPNPFNIFATEKKVLNAPLIGKMSRENG